MNCWRFGQILQGQSRSFQSGFLENPDNFQRVEAYTDISEYITGTVNLTYDDYISFLFFYKIICKCGLIPFSYTDCVVGEDVEMSFNAEPSVVERDGYYIISLNMRVL